MANFSLIIKDIKSLFFKAKLVFLWNLSALAFAYKTKQDLELKKTSI